MSKQIQNIVNTDRYPPASDITVKQASETTESQTNNELNVDEETGTTTTPPMSSSPEHVKTTLTVDQILSNKSNKSTQTDNLCLKCPYCSNKAF
jgi:hypothetical protein